MPGPGMEDPNKPKHHKMNRELQMLPRSKDMSWEQKCRISALRAACASQYSFTVTDEVILARAEVFRNALLHNGRMDDIENFIERVESESAVREVCPGCGSSSRVVKYPVCDAPHDVDGYCTHKWH